MNIFEWILHEAQRIREERQGRMDYIRFRQNLVKNANAARLRAMPDKQPAKASSQCPQP